MIPEADVKALVSRHHKLSPGPEVIVGEGQYAGRKTRRLDWKRALEDLTKLINGLTAESAVAQGQLCVPVPL